MMTTINLAWDYSDPEALAFLKEFRVYRLSGPDGDRIAGSEVITAAVPTDATPLAVVASSYGPNYYEVVPVDQAGNEGESNTIGYSVSNQLPKVMNLRVVG